MVQVTFVDDSLHLEVQGFDKLWALKSQLNIPLKHVRSVRISPDEASGWWHGIRFPGTNVPGVITAGTFYQHGQRVFWDVHDPKQTIVIQLHDDRYDELVIQVEDPETVIREIQQRISIL